MRKIAALAAFIGILTFSGCTTETKSGTEPTISITSKNYIANVNSGKLHSSTCDSLPYEHNRVYFETVAEAHAAGYTDHHKECMGS